MHTPDSSRYWIAHSYEERFHDGLEPENVDKVSTFAAFIILLGDDSVTHPSSTIYLMYWHVFLVSQEFLRLWFKDHCNPYEDEVSYMAGLCKLPL